MKHLLLLVALVLCSISPSLAQWVKPPQFEWGESFGAPGWESVEDVFIAPDGSIYLTGQVEYWLRHDSILTGRTHPEDDWGDAYVMKISKYGVYQWSKIIGGWGVDEGIGVGMDAQGKLWWAGNYLGNIAFDEDSLYSWDWQVGTPRIAGGIFLAELDPDNGNTISVQSIGGTHIDYVDEMVVLLDGDLIFAGTSASGYVEVGSDTIRWNVPQAAHGFLISYSPLARKVNWVRTFDLENPSSSSFVFEDIQIDKNNGVRIIGRAGGTLLMEDLQLFSQTKRNFLISISSEGLVQFTQVFASGFEAYDLSVDQWGNTWTVGNILSAHLLSDSIYQLYHEPSDGLLLTKTSPNGHLEEVYNLPGEIYATSVETNDENVLIGGFYKDTVKLTTELSLEFSPNELLSQNGFVIKLGPDLEPVWSKEIGDDQRDYVTHLLFSENGKMVVVGQFYLGYTTLDSFYVFQPFVQPIGEDHFIGLLEEDNTGPALPQVPGLLGDLFTVFPNPSSGNLTIWGAFENDQWQLQLFDQAGRLVWEQTSQTRPGQTRLPISIQSIAPGMYHLVCNSQSERFTTSIMIY